MRRHRITIPRPKPDFRFRIPPQIKLPSLYEIRMRGCP